MKNQAIPLLVLLSFILSIQAAITNPSKLPVLEPYYPCERGSYFNDTLKYCIQCPPGTYSNELNAKSCTPCAPGTYIATKGATYCPYHCAAGKYEDQRVMCLNCPIGTYSFEKSSGKESCLPCPPGTRGTREGSAVCEKCPLGTYASSPNTCTQCPLGTYSNDGAYCKTCPPGTVSTRLGSAECTQCSAGYYAFSTTTCTQCPVGTFSYQGAADLSECLTCPPGSITSRTGMGQCEKCPPGTYEVDRKTCSPCPVGTTSLLGSTRCEACPPGTITSYAGSRECSRCGAGTYEVNRRSCANCPIGTFAFFGVADISECQPCPPGTYAPYAGSKECQKCNPGTYPVDGKSCMGCPQGTFSPTPVNNVSECQSCPPGTYTSYTGSKECQKCNPGTYPVDGKSCMGCPQGTFSPTPASNVSECKPCPAGFMTRGTGSMECIRCNPGYYEIDRKTCVGCPMGTFSHTGVASPEECTPCPAGMVTRSTGNTECQRCGAGTYEVDRKNCVNCPQGTFSPIGVKDVSECQTCPAGQYTQYTGSKECQKCGPGTYELDRRTCVGCPQGTYSLVGVTKPSECKPCPAGFMTRSTGNTDCIRCNPGYYESERKNCLGCPQGTFSLIGVAGPSECTPCPPGMITRSAGNTECQRCQGGTYEVERKNCVNCPAGTFAPLGVADVSECEPCAPGYYTSYGGSKECMRCEAGTYEDGRKTCRNCPSGQTSPPAAKSISECKPK